MVSSLHVKKAKTKIYETKTEDEIAKLELDIQNKRTMHIVKNLLKYNMSIEMIQEHTGLSRYEVLKIQQEG